MRIQPNLSDQVPARARAAAQGAEVRAHTEMTHTAASAQQPVQIQASSIQNFRNLSNALSLAQTAQALIHRALEITSRLRNMAGEAMVAGKTNYHEVAQIMSEIKATMTTAPVANASPVITPALVPGGETAMEIPGPQRELDQLHETGNALLSGNSVTADRFSDIEETLLAKRDRIAVSLGEIETAVRNSVADERTGGEFVPETAVRQVALFIAENPDRAANLHSAIPVESVKNFLA